MGSSYTANDRYEQPATGEQAGTWGNVLNNDFSLIDSSINGVLTIPLSSTAYTLAMTDGAPSEARNKILVFTYPVGTPSGPITVTIGNPTIQKIYHVVNGTSQTLTIKQGTGAAVVLSAGFTKIVYCDGSGSAANVYEAYPINSDQIIQGTTQMFYTDAKARAALHAGNGITYDSSSGTISSSLTATGDLVYTASSAVMNYSFWSEGWQLLPLATGITAGTQVPRYRKANSNLVYLDGLFKSTAAAGALIALGTLPVGRRPLQGKGFITASYSGSTIQTLSGALSIDVFGAINVVLAAVAGGTGSLSGIFFPLD